MKSSNSNLLINLPAKFIFQGEDIYSFFLIFAVVANYFCATVDGWITVPWNDFSSIYGWQINQEATVEQLINLMCAGETVTVEPQYNIRGYCCATNDIGTTYMRRSS